MTTATAYLLGVLTPFAVIAVLLGLHLLWQLLGAPPAWEKTWCGNYQCPFEQNRDDHPHWPWWAWVVQEWRIHPRPCPFQEDCE